MMPASALKPRSWLSGPYRKAAWAEKRFSALREEFDAALFPKDGPDQLELGAKFDAAESTVLLSIKRAPELPWYIGMMIGDVLNNLRSALDHTAWALVKAGATPNPQAPHWWPSPSTTIRATSRGIGRRSCQECPTSKWRSSSQCSRTRMDLCLRPPRLSPGCRTRTSTRAHRPCTSRARAHGKLVRGPCGCRGGHRHRASARWISVGGRVPLPPA